MACMFYANSPVLLQCYLQAAEMLLFCNICDFIDSKHGQMWLLLLFFCGNILNNQTKEVSQLCQHLRTTAHLKHTQAAAAGGVAPSVWVQHECEALLSDAAETP